ncbi:MAG: IPT/TIG domain-containing protein [Alistipes onderdonkii]
MKNFYCKCRLHLWLACLTAGIGLSACSDGDEGGNSGYQPDKPIELESFYPKTGPIATQVIIKGKNFGTDAKALNVYFNEKRAAVISSTGDRMLVLAPKLPGEECVISVSVGENEQNKVQFDELFDYIIQTNVSTIAGGMKGTTMPEGTTSLIGSYFSSKPESGIAVDKHDNLYVRFSIDDGGKHRVLHDERGGRKYQSPQRFRHPRNGYPPEHRPGQQAMYIGTTPTSGTRDTDISIPSPTTPTRTWETSSGITTCSHTDGNFAPVWNAIQTFTMCPADNKFYFYTNEGVVARWDPATGKGEDLTPPGRFIDSQGDIMGVVFDPRDPNIVYFANQGQHCIYKHDIAAVAPSRLWAGRKNTAGYLDGPLAEAQFNYPCQMCVDPEGEAIYVTDRENHCIRKITLSNGYVSTFAGTPKSSGYVNGPADAAKFNKPVGLAITAEGNLYIGDSENYAIRRIAIE